MSKLTWQQERQRTASAAYRMRGGALESPSATLHPPHESSHSEKRDRLRRDRVIGHAVVGASGFAVFLALLPVMRSLGMFAIAMAAFYVGLRSFTFAISIGLGDPWGWTRDGGATTPLTWSDRAVMVGVAWIRRRSRASIDVPPADAIRVLPPEPRG